MKVNFQEVVEEGEVHPCQAWAAAEGEGEAWLCGDLKLLGWSSCWFQISQWSGVRGDRYCFMEGRVNPAGMLYKKEDLEGLNICLGRAGVLE